LLQQQFIRYTSNLMSIPSMKGCEWTQREIQNHLYKKIIFLNSRPPAFLILLRECSISFQSTFPL